MTYTNTTTVGQLVVERPARARIFEKFGIDYCCGGKKPLAQACTEKGIDLSAVLQQLSAAEEPTPDQTDWSKASMTELCDHIVATHHAYLREELPRLEFLAGKVANRHGEHRPQLVELHQVFQTMKAELESHMWKEENILFPMCRQMESATGPQQFHCGSIQNPIRVMLMEHDDAGHALERMRQLTDNYTLPADACNSYRALFDGLTHLESDLHQHIHKENNILFPRAVEAESQVQTCG